MARARRTDANHSKIVDYLRSIGWSVFDSSAFGRGFSDLVVSRLQHTALVEVKHGYHDLNDLQRKFRDGWQGAYFVVRTPEDAEKQLALWLLGLAKWK